MRERKKFMPSGIDDGRVIAPMNVEGMAWYAPKQASAKSGGCAGAPEKLTRGENIAFAFGVLKAVLLVSFAFIGGLLAFILFCVNIWLK